MESPYLWYWYISYFFSLLQPFENYFWISPDTLAVWMNFLSWIFVLLFWLALIKEFILLVNSYLEKHSIIVNNSIKDYSNRLFFIWWLLLLAWLTSWMWAFLVFVDNKTDLWILSLIILALYSWFHFIRQADYMKEEISQSEKKILWFNPKVFFSIIFSSLFFASASLAKPTALLDVMSFWLVLVWLRFWSIWTIWWGLSILWFLSIIDFKDTWVYISPEFWLMFLIIWLCMFSISILYNFKSKIDSLRKFLLWSIVFLLIIVVYKSPIVLSTKILSNSDLNFKIFIESVLLGQSNINTNTKNFHNQSITPSLLLTTTDTTIPQNRTGEKSSMSNDWPLYVNLKKAWWDNYKEDVWRYVWYWRRTYNNPYWWIFFQPFAWKCLWLDKVAVKLCNNQSLIDNLKLEELKLILNTIDNKSVWYNYLSDFINAFSNEDLTNQESIKEAVGNNYSIVTSLKNFINENSIRVQKVCYVAVWSSKLEKLKDSCLVQEDSSIVWKEVINSLLIDIPYNYLKVFNITFNWSLQNESSYYTDIGFVWLIVYFFVIIWFVYWLWNSNKLLITMNWVSVLWWIVWNLIWGWILWYWIWLIIWSILSFIIFILIIFINIYNNPKLKIYFEIAVAFFVLLIFAQLLMNFARISTQWWEWPFLHYKAWIWKQTIINQDLTQKQTSKVWYNSNDIFALQFPHYDKFINLADNRKQWEQIFLAWTYARYFLKNQDWIIADQMLNWLWEIFSDFDVHKSHARLLDKKIKYIAIDPNIWTVVMWWWNISLFDRFFAKINQLNWTFEEDWVITMLSRLVSENKIRLLSTNNLSIKYAYTLTDDDIWSMLWSWATNHDIILMRSKLATARFWPNKNDLLNFCVSIAKQRIVSLDFIDDFADVLWKTIDSNKIKRIVIWINQLNSVRDWINKYNQDISSLSNDEKIIFIQFLNLYVTLINDPKSLDNMLLQFIQSSTVSSSQIILFEVN